MRIEACLCGGLIVVPLEAVSPAPYVEAHNFLPGHQAWRAVSEGWHFIANHRFDDPRRERPTAARLSRDLSGSGTRASAAAFGGQLVEKVP